MHCEPLRRGGGGWGGAAFLPSRVFLPWHYAICTAAPPAFCSVQPADRWGRLRLSFACVLSHPLCCCCRDRRCSRRIGEDQPLDDNSIFSTRARPYIAIQVTAGFMGGCAGPAAAHAHARAQALRRMTWLLYSCPRPCVCPSHCLCRHERKPSLHAQLHVDETGSQNSRPAPDWWCIVVGLRSATVRRLDGLLA